MNRASGRATRATHQAPAGLDQKASIPDAWQPISTAPKDGTPLILFARAKTATASAPVMGWCIEGEWVECCFTPNRPVGLVPSHWMHRPDFPPQ